MTPAKSSINFTSWRDFLLTILSSDVNCCEVSHKEEKNQEKGVCPARD
jgi:hypothetical protein